MDDIDRIVKPRKPTLSADLPILAVDIQSGTWCDEAGAVGRLDDFIMNLNTRPSSFVATYHASELLAMIHEKWSFDPYWQFGVTPMERETYSPNARPGHKMILKDTVVNYFGWRHYRRSGRHKPNTYHYALDPVVFSSHPLPSGGSLGQLVDWGISLRRFCVANRLSLKATQGATARQFLRDPRFYPEPRRKVPKATNEAVRPRLPGNHYEVHADREREYTAIYIDQTKAHHYHAKHTRFPAADSLQAYGSFRGDKDFPWRSGIDRVRSFTRGFSGVIFGRLALRDETIRRWVPDHFQSGKRGYYYTSEADLLETLKLDIVEIYAAWGSTETDTGLNQYARWALDELERDAPQWKKTLLLSTYGSMASKPRMYSVGHAKSSRGNLVTLPAGRLKLPAFLSSTTNISEPSTNNVLHRGLIEAATRCESLMFAHHLEGLGFRVLSVYADAVMVDADDAPELPMLQNPWRVKATLHHLRFVSSNAFISGEMTKLPGGQTGEDLRRVSGEHRTYRRQLRMM